MGDIMVSVESGARGTCCLTGQATSSETLLAESVALI